VTVIDDAKSCLTTYWNTGVTAIPTIYNLPRATNSKGTPIQFQNGIGISDNGESYRNVDPCFKYRDIDYNVGLRIQTTYSEGKGDNVLSETLRILGATGMSGYDGREIKNVTLADDSVNYIRVVRFVAKKYNQRI
jgi:hypothetical protein